MNITVVGLGKLGAALAAFHAQKHNVIGVDLDKKTVNAINAGRAPVQEPGLQKLISKVVKSGNLKATTDISEAAESDLSLIIVPTPSMDNGAFTSRHVLRAVEGIGKAIEGQANRHVVVVCSTVMPGECAGPITMTLEKFSGRTVGEDVGIVHSPEFVALGSVLADMEQPDVAIVGESDPMSGATYAALIPEGTPIRYMSLTSAEIAKLSLNAYVTMKISFANTLGEICENFLDADAYTITEAVGLDTRVGSAYFRPGGPYSGVCFPRDARAFARVGEEVGVPGYLAAATDEVNKRQVQRTIDHIKKHGRTRIGILGFGYKPKTAVFEKSFGLNLAKQLIYEGYQVAVYDPLIKLKPEDAPPEIVWHMGPEPCFGNTTTTIIATPDPQIVNIFPDIFSNDGRVESVVIDCWDIVPPSPWTQTHIIKLGKGEGCY